MMKIRELNLDDYIWFVEPGSNISYPATVTNLVYNDSKPYAEVLVGQHKVRIDDSYDIAKAKWYIERAFENWDVK